VNGGEASLSDPAVTADRRRYCFAQRWCRSCRSQGGFSLIEVLVALVLSSMVVMALAAGLLTLVRVTASTNERQQLQLAAGNFSESMKAFDYLQCGTDADYESAYGAWGSKWNPPVGFTAEVVQVEYWTRVTETAGPGAFQSACPDPAQDEGTQLVTLRVEKANGADRQVQVVKADR